MSPRISRRGMLALGAGSLIGAPAILRSAQAQSRTVYVNSYGGVWETSWRKAFFEPFTAQTGIAIKTVPGVSFAKLKALLRKATQRTVDGLWDAIGHLLDLFPPAECANHLANSGYPRSA